jgi:cysteine desulfurase/selenocysteine lyase
MTAGLDIERIRSDFPILSRQIHGRPLVYLDNAATTQKPRAVLDKLRDFYGESNANIHRGVHYLSEQASSAWEEARESVRRFINAESSREIIFTHGTTESINIVAHCFGPLMVNAGDEVVISEMEHHSNIVPWQMLCHRRNATLKIIPFDAQGVLRTDLLGALLSEKTRLIALTAVSNVLGTVNPIRQIVAQAHAAGIPVIVDGAQAVQHGVTDVRALGCDFFAFSGHKLYAETGIGVLYGKERLLERMPPYQFGGGMISSVDFGKTTFAELPFKFEAGTPNIAGAISLRAAIEYLGGLGLERIANHERQLLRQGAARLCALRGVRVLGPLENRCGVLSFTMDGAGAYDAAVILDKMGIAVRSGTHCAEPVLRHFGIRGALRASVALYNTMAEIDYLADSLTRVQRMFVQ